MMMFITEIWNTLKQGSINMERGYRAVELIVHCITYS